MGRMGAELLIESLTAQGASHAFGVPGESYLAVLDALRDSAIRFVLCRQEGGAAYMAEAWGKLTGQPGLCFVTRGPGATNAAIGVHAAMQASTPMILFIGQVARGMRGREAFQEVDYRAFFAPLAKWAVEIDAAERVPEIVGRAYATALSGRPGPVVVALPEDMLVERAEVAPLSHRIAPRPPVPSPADMADVTAILSRAARPLVLLGGGGWDAEAGVGRAALARLANRLTEARIPVAVTFRCQDLIDNAAPAYAGDAGVGMAPAMQARIRAADTILALNIRFGENTTAGYTLLRVPEPDQRLIHVHPSAGELGKIYQTPHMIQAGPIPFAQALAQAEIGGAEARVDWFAAARADYEAQFAVRAQPGPLDMGAVLAHLRAVLADDAIVTCGAGNFAIWPGKLFRYGPDHRFLGPQAGSMGYGLPAAVAAKILHPTRPVVCFAGDGDFQMNGQELGTALQADARPVVLVVNNRSYGTIRMHQERDYPGRVSGTEIVNPDFPALARAYGMVGLRVEETAAFAPIFDEAMASPSGALVELVIDTDQIAPGRTLTEIREAAR